MINGSKHMRETYLKKEMYEEKCMNIVLEHSLHTLREFYVPLSGDMEEALIGMFARDGKRLTAPIESYRTQGKEMRLYKFNSTFVLLERVNTGDVMVVRFSRNIGRWLRHGVVGVLYSLREETRAFAARCTKPEELQILSDLWRQYTVVDKSARDFVEWVKTSSVFDNFASACRNHVVRI